MLQCRQRLWPQKPYKADTEKKDLEGKKKSEQKRLVRERQQKLMESFANMRKEFIEKNLDVAGNFQQWCKFFASRKRALNRF